MVLYFWEKEKEREREKDREAVVVPMECGLAKSEAVKFN